MTCIFVRFILRFSVLKRLQGFRLNIINQTARTSGGGVHKALFLIFLFYYYYFLFCFFALGTPRFRISPTCLNFIFIDSLNHRFSYIIRHQMLFCKLQTSCSVFQVSTKSFLRTRTTLLNIGRVIRKSIFSVIFAKNRAVMPF